MVLIVLFKRPRRVVGLLYTLYMNAEEIVFVFEICQQNINPNVVTCIIIDINYVKQK